MTSMLLTLSSASVAVMAAFVLSPWPPHSNPLPGGERGSEKGEPGLLRRSRLLRAVARRDALLLGVFERRFLVHVLKHLAIGLDPVGDELPVLTVPLLDADV